MATNLANWAESAALDWLLGGANPTRPTSRTVHLYTAPPAEDGSGGTEVSGGSYAAQTVTFAAASGGVAASSADVDFPQATAGWGYVWWATIVDNAGNHLFSGPLSTIARTFTAAASSDTLTSYAHGRSNGDRVCVETAPGASLPTGLSERTLYYVVGATTDTLQLSTTSGGAAINLTGDGAGVLRALDAARDVQTNDTYSIPSGQLTATLS